MSRQMLALRKPRWAQYVREVPLSQIAYAIERDAMCIKPDHDNRPSEAYYYQLLADAAEVRVLERY